mmetsp:Transcript_43332/g.94332  ORF Transcript_43332/g.94332 Transcript_43332/m.94332 type:complete len:81 (+) Transcript_43332:714-956(+)
MVPRAILTAMTMQARWIAAWPSMETKTAGWNRDRKGRTGCMRSQGEEYAKANEAVVRSQCEAIICLSELLEPSKDRAERT